MVFARGGFLALLVWVTQCGIGAAEHRPDAVCYRDVVYFSVDKLAEHLHGTASLSSNAREVKLKTKDKEWEFGNGGLHLKPPTGKELTLEHPLLVLEGKHFLPLEECAPAFGYRVAPQGKNPTRLLLTIGDKEQVIEPSPLGSTYHRHNLN